MIKKYTDNYDAELTEFIYQHNRMKNYFIAWIPETKAEIEAMDKSSFYLCIVNDKIIGCLGIYLSIEQKVARLLGPIIDTDYFDQMIDSLYQKCLEEMPKDMAEIKIAFFEENTFCTLWCDRMGYELYNAEKTMQLNKSLYQSMLHSQLDHPEVAIKPYEPQYKPSLEAVHPKGVFYTLDELVSEISDHHHLLIALIQNQAMGYIYFEETTDQEQGEIVLFHVRADARGNGVGTRLLHQALSNLMNSHVNEIMLNVRADNYAAQKLYLRNGFVEKETIFAYRKSLDQ